MKRATTLSLLVITGLFAVSLAWIRKEALDADFGSGPFPEYGLAVHQDVSEFSALVADGTFYGKHREPTHDQDLRLAARSHSERYEQGLLRDIPRTAGEDSLQFGTVAQIHSAKMNLVIRLKALAQDAEEAGNRKQAAEDLTLALRLLQIMRDVDTSALAKYMIVEERLLAHLDPLLTNCTPENVATIARLTDAARLEASVQKAFDADARFASYSVPNSRRSEYRQLATSAFQQLERSGELPAGEIEKAPRELRLIIHRTHGMLSAVRRRSLS